MGQTWDLALRVVTDLVSLRNYEESERSPMKALLVGINQYKTIKSLNGCINDVLNVRDTLVSSAGLNVSDIQILQDADATTANIRKGLGDLAAGAVPGQRLWVHFSGHGSQLL